MKSTKTYSVCGGVVIAEKLPKNTKAGSNNKESKTNASKPAPKTTTKKK